MAEKIFIEIEYDDKGAQAKVVSLDQAVDHLTTTAGSKAAGAFNQLTNAVEGSNKAAGTARQTWLQTATAYFTGTSAADALKQALSAVWGVVQTGAGVVGSAVAASQRYTNAFMGLRSVAAAFGVAQQEAKQAAIDLSKDGLMTVSESAEGLKNLLATGFELPKAINLMNAFKDSSAFGRQGMLEFGQAVVGATQGIKNQMSQMVDNSGVTKNLSMILKEQGFAISDLARVTTDATVRNALYNGLMKETQRNLGDAARLSETYTGQVSRLNTSYQTLLATWGSSITENAAVATAIKFVNAELQRAIDASTHSGKAFDLVTDAVIWLTKALVASAGALQTVISIIYDTKIVFGELSLATFNLGAITDNMNVSFLRWMSSIAVGAEKQKYYKEQLQAAIDLQGAQKRAYEDGAAAINADHAARDKWNAAVEEGKKRLQDLIPQLEAARGKTVEYGKTGTKIAEEKAAADEKTTKAAQKEADAVSAAMDSLRDDVLGMDKVLDRAQEKEDRYWQEWAKDAHEARLAVEEEVHAIDVALQGISDRKLGPNGEGNMDLVSQQVLFQNFTDNVNEGHEAVKKTKMTTEELVGTILDAAMAAWDFAKAMQHASQSADRMDRQMQGMKAGAQAGSMFGPWGTIIGGFVGLVAGSLLGDPKFVGIMRDVGKQWGLTISQEMAKTIEQSLPEAMGNRQVAALLNLRGIIDDVGGVTAENFARLGLMLTDVVREYTRGTMTAAQATKVLDQTFGDFVKLGTDEFGVLNGQMREFIRMTKAAGLEVQAVNNYLWDQAKVAIGGSNAVINASKAQFDSWQETADAIKKAQDEIDKLNEVESRGRGIEWTRDMQKAQDALTAALTKQHSAAEGAKGELENLGHIAVATYAAAIAAGMSHAAALKAASPGLTQLSQAYANLGLNVEDVGLKQLLVQNQFLTKNPDLIAGIDGLSASFIALDNMGLLTADTFSSLQEAGSRMYERLVDQAKSMGLEGAEANRAALVPMQEYLHRAAEQAERLGLPLDENTQKMIDQSKELGIWKDTGKSANELLLSGITDLINAMKELIMQLRSVPAEVNTRVNVTRTTTNEGGDGGPLFHSGGYIGGTSLRPRGMSDVQITAQTGEYVISRRGVAAVGLKTLAAINRGRPDEAAGLRGQAVQITGDTHVHGSFEDEDEMVETIGRAHVRKLKAAGVRFGRRRF